MFKVLQALQHLSYVAGQNPNIEIARSMCGGLNKPFLNLCDPLLLEVHLPISIFVDATQHFSHLCRMRGTLGSDVSPHGWLPLAVSDGSPFDRKLIGSVFFSNVVFLVQRPDRNT